MAIKNRIMIPRPLDKKTVQRVSEDGLAVLSLPMNGSSLPCTNGSPASQRSGPGRREPLRRSPAMAIRVNIHMWCRPSSSGCRVRSDLLRPFSGCGRSSGSPSCVTSRCEESKLDWEYSRVSGVVVWIEVIPSRPRPWRAAVEVRVGDWFAFLGEFG